MGDGTQRIIRADPNAGVEFTLAMRRNAFVATGKLSLEPSGDSTKVTWRDTGEVDLNPLHRYFAVFLDRMMGPTFERSLAALKQKAEAGGARSAQ